MLFVVDWEAWPAHDAARDELVALLERDGGGVLGGVPVAVFFNNVDYKGLDECGVMEWEMVVRVWREYLPAEGGVEVFMGSVEDQWGYLEAFTWLLGFCG